MGLEAGFGVRGGAELEEEEDEEEEEEEELWLEEVEAGAGV